MVPAEHEYGRGRKIAAPAAPLFALYASQRTEHNYQPMSATSGTTATMTVSSSALPVLLMVAGTEQTRIPIMKTPFGIGRKTDKDLVIVDPRVSRDHAQIVMEGGDFFLVDLGSKHGTFVNGERVDRYRVNKNDRMEFGAGDKAHVIFSADRHDTNAA